MAGFAEHVADVEADGPAGQLQPVGDFLIAQVLADQVQDLDFPLGQGGVVKSKGGPFLDIREQMLPVHGTVDAVQRTGLQHFSL